MVKFGALQMLQIRRLHLFHIHLHKRRRHAARHTLPKRVIDKVG
jgi:hypothetical protein